MMVTRFAREMLLREMLLREKLLREGLLRESYFVNFSPKG